MSLYAKYTKRIFDIVFSFFALIILSPVMLIIAIIVKLDSEGPIIFKQARLGRYGNVFNMRKFRTMVIDAESFGSGVYSYKDDARVTRSGRVLRAFSIDELPQCISILMGEMSFIGPRPPLTYHPWHFDEYSDEQKAMFRVRPGVSGWAQVNGRKTVEWNKRIEMSCWYANNISFALDAKILFLTIWKVLRNESNTNVGNTVDANY